MPVDSTPRSFAALISNPPGKARAHHGERSLQTRTRVGRATDDLQELRALPRRHATDLQLVGLRVPLGRDDFGDDNLRERRRRRLERVELESRHGQARAQLACRPRHVDPFSQP